MSKETVYLVDGTSLCYRSFFAINLSNSKGFPTGSVYGAYRTIKKLIAKYNPLYLGFCFDVSRKTFRQDKFKEYKIQRPALPDGLGVQIPLVKELVEYLGIKIIEKEGFEADDVIASLCKAAVEDGLSVVIVTSDKDLSQLMTNDKVVIYNYHKDIVINRDSFIKENQFTPEAIVDYLSLAGDSADNIPGARGIGKVGAAKLIKEFGTIDNIFKNLKKIPPRIKNILEENKNNILLSKELVKLETPSLGLNWPDLRIGQNNTEGLYQMFSKLEFKAFLKEIPTPECEFNLKVKEGLTKGVLAGLVKEPVFLTVGRNIVYLYDQKSAAVYQLAKDDSRAILTDPKIRKVSHGFKQARAEADFDFSGIYFDIKIAAYLLDSSLVNYELETLVSHFLGKHLNDIPPQARPQFVAELYRVFLEQLRLKQLDKLFFEVEMPLIAVLSQMQKQGVKVQLATLRKLLTEVEVKIKKASEAIFKESGHEFNLNSPKQLATVLFNELGIPPLKKTKTGYSTNEEVLEKLSLNHAIAKEIIKHRQLNKLKNTYLVPLIDAVIKNKGMLHTKFHQTKAQTGRLSSSDPNLQSIPQKGEFSQGLRKAFIPSHKDGFILAADYSQIELRILAHLSQDENLIKAFRQDLDIHAHTAALLFNLDPDKVSSLERNIAKRVNFGIIYGMSSYGLAKELKISNTEAQNFIDDYFRRYPGVETYTKKVQTQAKKNGFVTTVLGRQRRLPEIKSSNLQLREFALRQAINAPIQGSCADLIKIAMIAIVRELASQKLATKLTIQIHDELIFDVLEKELNKSAIMVRDKMESALKLDVPIKVNLKAGKNWGDLVKIL